MGEMAGRASAESQQSSIFVNALQPRTTYNGMCWIITQGSKREHITWGALGQLSKKCRKELIEFEESLREWGL